MKSLSVGHFSNQEQGTGFTVFLIDGEASASYYIAGSAPATHEVAILDLESNLDAIHALAFTGGSAFGLTAVAGVMQWLSERGRGKPKPHGGVVPIVPTAGIYDLAFKAPVAPTPEQAYQACVAATLENFSCGSIGAGTGATVGKLIPGTTRMAGGLGVANITLQNGLQVIAYAVVNAVGDVRDEKNNIIAGAQYPDGSFADCQQYLLSGENEKMLTQENTTLVAVFTNAQFSKNALKRIAKMAIAGMAQAIAPVFTPYDGDIIFCVSMGRLVASEMMVGTVAVEAVRRAIVNAVVGNGN